jgi:hypothetical protein
MGVRVRRAMASAPSPGFRMAQWVVLCPECRSLVPHSTIPARPETAPFDPLWPTKPEVPDGGVNLTCPSCSTTNAFQRVELMYRPS